MNSTRFLLLASFALLAGCSRPAPPQEPVRAVKLVTVGLASLTAEQSYAGEVRAQSESRLSFRVGGKLIRRQAELGQRVQAGQVLAQLDAQDYALAAAAAGAQVAAARTSRDLAAADYKRFEALKAQNFISGAELERRAASLQGAQAQFEQAQSQYALQGNQTNYAVLVSDGAGVVTSVDVEVGQVVAAGTPVVRVAMDGARDVVFAVPEGRVVAMKIGLPVQVRGWAAAGTPEASATAAPTLPGQVREVAASADPVTRTYLVKVALAAQPVVPALGATVTVLVAGQAQAAQVLKLPTSALRQEGQQTAVWVLDPQSMTLRSQVVQVRAVDGNQVVVQSGLEAGMQVVTAGVHVLSAGQKVTIYKSNVPENRMDSAQEAIKKIAEEAPVAPLPVPAASSAASAASAAVTR